ncbi:Uncharacterized protein TCM_019279 [Theobroma cacao]|uniref:Uncharacterized protein n=1 Tax=Theobroma cacao TaxID=3641 RepID=A0A061EGL7_THECC|nr:Uncharacterized protein TCM_019279 [Theobroma cacao]
MRRKEKDKLARMDANYQKRKEIVEFNMRREEKMKVVKEQTTKNADITTKGSVAPLDSAAVLKVWRCSANHTAWWRICVAEDNAAVLQTWGCSADATAL